MDNILSFLNSKPLCASSVDALNDCYDNYVSYTNKLNPPQIYSITNSNTLRDIIDVTLLILPLALMGVEEDHTGDI